MKNILIRVVLAMMIPAASFGQEYFGGVTIGEPAIVKEGESVNITFSVVIDADAVPKDRSLLLGPELTDGSYRWSLPVIIVHGKGAKISLERQILATGSADRFSDALFTGNGSTVEYSAAIPYQGWMEGAELRMETFEMGRRPTTVAGTARTIAGNIRLTEETEIILVAEDISEPVNVTPAAPTTGEILAQSNPFILPLPSAQIPEPEGLFNADRENTVTVHYAQGKYDIDPAFGDNREILSLLESSIRRIQESPDSEVAIVVVAGFASPEGSYEFNDRLAWNRAQSLKEYLLVNTRLESGKVEAFNGSVDWQGLRMLVEASGMEGREAVLRIIDTVPIWDGSRNVGRLGELMRLDGGRPYRYMYEHFFPQLRNSAYIRVYYRDKTE